MKKEEYIAKYGVEKYNEQKKKIAENTRKRNQRNKEKNIVKVLTDIDNSVTAKGWVSIPTEEPFIEEDIIIAHKFQNHLRKLWSKETTQKFILVVDEWRKKKNGKMLMKCNLTQLNMDAETRERFNKIVLMGSESFLACRS